MKFKFKNLRLSNSILLLEVDIDDKYKFQASLDYSCFSNTIRSYVTEEILDVLLLATAIYTVDKYLPRWDKSSEERIQIYLPLENSRLKSLSEKISFLLLWLTQFHWEFFFESSICNSRQITFQGNISFSYKSSEIILWSGGLDALSALYIRYRKNQDKDFFLVGSGGNLGVRGQQKKLFNELPLELRNKCTLLQVPIDLKNKPKNISENKLMRARGAVFILIGAACAGMMNNTEIKICENGIGAINLPYSSSSLNIDHSRSVHPRTLFLLEDLLSSLFNKKFKIDNPFLFWTKSEMCQYLVNENNSRLIYESMSCDSPHRKPFGKQCGYCTSCLLRRMSIESCGIEDKSEYLIKRNQDSISEDVKVPIRAMLSQAFVIREILDISVGFEKKWSHLSSQFYQFRLIEDLDIKSIMGLYDQYSREWTSMSRNSFSEILSFSEVEELKAYSLDLFE
jgi:7-cyano-7-deazaguanine synthase in queuosine biosynthesis